MNQTSDSLLLWILLPIFLGVGLYLVWYARRRNRMLLAFARARQFHVNPESQPQLQKLLDECFALKGDNLARSFDQLATIVHGHAIWVFRSVELLDLNPYGQAGSTHFSRIAALFDVAPGHDEFFLLDKSMLATPRRPGAEPPDTQVLGLLKRIATSAQARHALSVTLAHGHGLIYFEPLITGGETARDIECLYEIAKRMREELTKHEKTQTEPAAVHAAS